MANKAGILNRLREYEVPPPPGVFDALMNRLEGEAIPGTAQFPGAWQNLQELEVPPPAFLQVAITAVIQKPLLAALQDHSVTPPADAFNHILQSVAPQVGRQRSKASPVIAIFRRYRAIAAILLVIFTGLAVYYNASRKPGSEPASLSQTKQPAAAAAVAANAPKAAGRAKQAADKHALYDNDRTENYFENNTFLVEEEGLPLVDNDFIVTFASYNYKELPDFLVDEKNSELTVRLDQYSYFTLSENMLSDLKKLYDRRRNGAPTRKARKEKSRLEEWKKADDRYFDYHRSHNPLDPLDLAEFIFQ